MDVISVSELNKYIKNLFEDDPHLTSIFVRGELSNFKVHSSGHCYFTLKDASSNIRCIMFKGNAQYLKFKPKDGMKVVILGQVRVYERDGQYQFYAARIILDGVGELNLAFNELKEKLQNEGLFDEARKKPLPYLPKKIGIVTSATGAAIRDIYKVAKSRYKGIELILYPVLVQGEEACLQIKKAIEFFNTAKNVDVLIVGRGGGSIEELWSFNDENVVRAIANSKIPVISAVGHETDYTLADFVADVRAATPSNAAEIAVPDTTEIFKYLNVIKSSLYVNIKRKIENKENSVSNLVSSYIFTQPYQMLDSRQQMLDSLVENLEETIVDKISNRREKFNVLTEKLNILSPLSVFSRGYSITKSKDGQIITDAQDVKIDQTLEIILKKGTVEATVSKIKN